jgi:hypothetical protein
VLLSRSVTLLIRPFLTYVWLDQFFDWKEIVKDIGKRPFIMLGFAVRAADPRSPPRPPTPSSSGSARGAGSGCIDSSTGSRRCA